MPDPSRAHALAFWLKTLYYHGDGWTVMPGEVKWVSDVALRAPSGGWKYRRDGKPAGEPGWQRGDEIALYYSGTYRIPVLAEVVDAPSFDPDFVQANAWGNEPDAGQRWPWVTRIRGLLRTDLERAPTLEDVGIEHKLMMRRIRLRLTADQHRRLVNALSPGTDRL